jgi:hypothetical protein
VIACRTWRRRATSANNNGSGGETVWRKGAARSSSGNVARRVWRVLSRDGCTGGRLSSPAVSSQTSFTSFPVKRCVSNMALAWRGEGHLALLVYDAEKSWLVTAYVGVTVWFCCSGDALLCRKDGTP